MHFKKENFELNFTEKKEKRFATFWKPKSGFGNGEFE